MSAAETSIPAPDVLLLHGQSIDVVRQVKDALTSLGLSAETVLGLASGGQPPNERVRSAIERCLLPVVIATFNDTEPSSANARPNVIDELRLCVELRPADTIILREQRDGKSAGLQSNLDGRSVIIPIERSNLLAGLCSLFRELSQRRLIAATDTRRSAHSDGAALNAFLDQMDSIWDHQLDDAWNAIHLQDYKAERKITQELDRFFQRYHDVVVGLVKHRKTGDALSALCDVAIRESESIALRCWELAIEGKRDALLRSAHRSPATTAGGRAKRTARPPAGFEEKVNRVWEQAQRSVRMRKKPFVEQANALRQHLAQLDALGSKLPEDI